MHDASARASDIANRALERIDQFHLFGGQKKRLDAAHEAFSELEALDRFTPIVAVTKTMVQTLEDPAARLVTSRVALAAISRSSAALAAGTVPPALIAAAVLTSVPEPMKDATANAAFAALPQDGFTGHLATLSHTQGAPLLEIAARAPAGDVREQAASAAAAIPFAALSDRLPLARQLVARLPDDPQTDLLEQLAALHGIDPEALCAGLDVLSRGGDVGRAVLRATDDIRTAAAVGRCVLRARPSDGWREWAEPLLGDGDESDAAIARSVIDQKGELDLSVLCDLLPRLSETVKPSKLFDAFETALADVGSPRAADVKMLRALLAGDGVEDGPALQLACRIVRGDTPMEAVSLAREAQQMVDESAPSRMASLARAILLEGARRGHDGARMLSAPLNLPLADTEQQARVALGALRELARFPATATAAQATMSCMRAVEDLTWSEDALSSLAVTLPLAAPWCKTPDETESLAVLQAIAGGPHYDPRTVLLGVKAGVESQSDDGGVRLVKVTACAAEGMNWWVDQARAARLGLASEERRAMSQGDATRAACARFLLRLHDEVDVSDEKERSKALIAGLEWLDANHPTAFDSALGALASRLRKANGTYMRDIRTGQLAAEMMAESAATAGDAQRSAEAAFLQFLAAREAENVSQRCAALFNAMTVQCDGQSTGPQRLAHMGAVAVSAYKEVTEDQVQVALRCLDLMAQRDGQSATSANALKVWLETPLYAHTQRGLVAHAVMDALASTSRPSPGGVAEAAATLAENLDPVNVSRLEASMLEAVEKMARALGDDRFVPEVVAATRASLDCATDTDDRQARLRAGLHELSRFQGDVFEQVVKASRLERTPQAGARVEQGGDEVVIGGIRIPRKE